MEGSDGGFLTGKKRERNHENGINESAILQYMLLNSNTILKFLFKKRVAEAARIFFCREENLEVLYELKNEKRAIY